MKRSERLSALGVLVFAVGALVFLSPPIASLIPAIAQTNKQQQQTLRRLKYRQKVRLL